MGFVEDDQVPARRVEQALDARRPLQRVDAGDQPVVLGEGVGLAVGDVALGTEDLEIEVEDLVQLPVPVVHQTRRNHHQRAIQFAPAGQLAQDQRRLDGLAEPDFVRDQKPTRRRGRDAVRQHDLMRKQVDPRRRQRRRALHHRQEHGPRRRAKPLRARSASPRRSAECVPSVESCRRTLESGTRRSPLLKNARR